MTTKINYKRMKQLIIILFSILLSTSLSAQTATELIRNMQQQTTAGDSEMRSTIHIYDGKGNQRVREITTFTRKTPDCSQLLIQFTAPSEVKGTTLLIYDYPEKADQQWIYLPATGKVRRIVSTEKGRNFMGSEFTNADMSQLNTDEYQFEDIGTESVKGIKCRKIKATGRNPQLQNEHGYSSKIIYLDAERHIPHKEELFDRTGKLQRELVYENYKPGSNGKWVAWQMTMRNLQNSRRSVMTVVQFSSGINQSARKFEPTSLGN